MNDVGTQAPAALLLGATSGIGSAIGRELGQRNYRIVLAARDTAEADALAADIRIRSGTDTHVLAFDAEAYAAHPGLLDEATRWAGGRLDLLVLCFGYMTEQERCQEDFALARRTIDGTLTGAVSLLEAAARQFASERHGVLCVLSSVAGDRGRQSNYIYGAAKAGLTAYLQGLRNRLYHSGVHVVTIKPGFVDTKMTWGKPGLFLVATPENAARSIVRAVDKRRNAVYVPWFWRLIMTIIRAIPEWQFKRMRL